MPTRRPVSTVATMLAALCFVAQVHASGMRSGHVLVCEESRAGVVTVTESQYPQLLQLVRQGRATWAPSVLDSVTSHAMAEGKGIWRRLTPGALFEAAGTATPSAVMASIAMRESGRSGWYWPWTINHAGKSLYFDSKEEAVAAAQRLLQSGSTSFDVGLMQVNWRWNHERFTGLADAFEPLTNIRVADQIVQEHLRQTGSIGEAVGRYHSKTPSLKHRYLTAVNQQYMALARVPASSLDEACRSG